MSKFLYDFVVLLLLSTTSLALECVKKDACSCEMDDGSGVINITSIGLEVGPRFQYMPSSLPGEAFLYSYNPCFPFTDGAHCVGVNACQYTANLTEQYVLGTPADAVSFSLQDDNVVMTQTHKDGVGILRTFKVTLVCDKNNRYPTFNMKGEVSVLMYEATLSTKCACPGECSEKPPPSTQGCVRRNQCQCDMADGSGRIDLSQIGLGSLLPRFKNVLAPDGFFYSYNPCFPFDQGTCQGAAVCQQSGDTKTQYLVGNSSTATFTHDEDNKISVIYTAEDQQGNIRTSVVSLICDKYAKTSAFEALGELQKGTYYFLLTSSKVCPQQK